MKLLIMCEGPNEKEIINLLLKNDCLNFTEDDLLGLTPYHARQIKSSAQVRTELNLYPGEVKIYRIGDKQSDRLKIPAEYKSKIISIENNPDLLVRCIKDYKKYNGSHGKDEHYLAELLK